MRVRIRDEMRYISARHCLKGLDLMAYRKKKKMKLHSEKYFKGRSPTAPQGRKAEILTSVDQMRIDDQRGHAGA